ncbi:hypothetical protein CYMTET_11196, partial [Cymbomonas tetramitiformis]
YQPSPFFVLDEVDAALDPTNVEKIADFIVKRSAGKGRHSADAASFQSVVISLKDTFYDKADALIGVCRNPDEGCSATYTFDLGRF